MSYVNSHKPESSVYLVNALVPDDPRVRIAGQRRDRAQHGLTLDYDVTPDPWWTRAALVAGLAAAAVTIVATRAGRYKAQKTIRRRGDVTGV